MSGEFVESDGARLYFEVDGSGPALVLVHAGVANLRMWDPHVPVWSGDHTVVRFDTRGFGRTEEQPDRFTRLVAEFVAGLPGGG